MNDSQQNTFICSGNPLLTKKLCYSININLYIDCLGRVQLKKLEMDGWLGQIPSFIEIVQNASDELNITLVVKLVIPISFLCLFRLTVCKSLET